jgi:hypothetical protein
LIYPALYNGPINYYARLVREQKILLEQFEHYTKQTYRNRFEIMGPNGILSHSVPVKKRRGVKNLIRDIRIDYDTPWNKIHWRSLEASYASSPFFAYMKDELAPFYEQRIKYLMDLNLGLIRTTLDLIGVNIPVECSNAFKPLEEPSDPRILIHPKLDHSQADPSFLPVAYHQVFAERFGFISNLSILDLLFNQGPDSLTLLRKSLRT